MATRTPGGTAPHIARVTTPTAFVLFGATGDLCRKMVLPAFFELFQQDLLPRHWLLVGNGRGGSAGFDFVEHVRQALRESKTRFTAAQFKGFAARLRFADGDFSSDEPSGLRALIDAARAELGPNTQLVHYLAIPPLAFGEVTADLGKYGYADGARVVFEKPFGTSMKGFRQLDRAVHKVLDESQIYRIDHFLGKQATQQLHVLRFANGLFDAMWHRDHVRAVQVDVPERIGVTDRALFYDATGAVLDMLVTHLFQVAAEVAMEPPRSLSADDLQASREHVIGRFRPIDPAEVVLGQFRGYKQLDGVRRGSRTETYVAARLWVDTPRWKDVPFLLRTGKRMPVGEQKVSLILREPAGPLEHLTKAGNVLTFSLKGDGQLDLSMIAERPDAKVSFGEAHTSVVFDKIRGADPISPYARLIHDALVGDRSLFTRPDGLAATWKVLARLLDDRPAPRPYAQGSWGPAAARALAAPDGWLLGQ